MGKNLGSSGIIQVGKFLSILGSSLIPMLAASAPVILIYHSRLTRTLAMNILQLVMVDSIYFFLCQLHTVQCQQNFDQENIDRFDTQQAIHHKFFLSILSNCIVNRGCLRDCLSIFPCQYFPVKLLNEANLSIFSSKHT